MATLNWEQTAAYAGADPAGLIELMADLYFPRTPVHDVAAWRNQVRQTLRGLAERVRQGQLGPAGAADLIDRRFYGRGTQVERRTSEIVDILREAPTDPDPALVTQARRLLRQHAPTARKAARARAAGPAPESAPTPAGGPAVPATSASVSGEVATLDATRTFVASLAEHLREQVLARTATARATLAARRADTATLALLDRVHTHTTAMIGTCEGALEHLDTHHGQMETAVNSTPEVADLDFYGQPGQVAVAAAAPAEQEKPLTSEPDAAIRIATDDTEQSQVVVTPGPDAVRIDLADTPDEPDGGGGPFVLLDEAGVAALADAGVAMATAEKATRAEYKKLDARMGRLEQRREQIQNRPYETEQHAALRGEYDALCERGDDLYIRMRKQLNQLAAGDRGTFQDLDAQQADGDRPAIRAAQRQVLTDAGIGQHDPFFTDQAEYDEILDRKAELRQRVAAIPVVPLTPKEKDELDRINTEIAAVQATLLDMAEEKELIAGVIPAQGGAGLAWCTTVREEGAVSHQLTRRPAGTDASEHTSDDVEVPRLTGPQLRRVVQAATSQHGGVAR